MALFVIKNCEECGKEYLGEYTQTTCQVCIITKKHENHDKHFENLDKLSVEERLRIVEEFMYEYNNRAFK